MTMNVQEKLVELFYDNNIICDQKIEGLADDVMDIIANGVTVQEWISVDDRLPEDDSDVLAYLQIDQEGRIYPANYAKGVWFDCIFNTPATGTTTHWMPLPEPPKGE